MNSSWKIVKIGDVLNQKYKSESVNPEKSYNLLGLSLEGRGLFNRETKLGSEISCNTLNEVCEDDFIYSRLFAWKGAFDVVQSKFNNCFVSDEFPLFTPNPEFLNVKYLNYYFNQSSVWHEVENYCIGVTKASRNRFKEKYFLSLEIPLPTIEEQKRIVKILDSVKSKIELIKKLRVEQEKEIENYLFSTFSDLIKKYSTVDLSDGLFLKSNFIMIHDDSNYKLCRVQTKAQGVVLREKKQGLDIKTKEQQICESGQFIVAEMDARFGGYGLIPEELDGSIVSSHYFLFDVNEINLNKKYLEYYSKTNWFFKQVAAQGSTNYAAIRPKQVLSYQIPLPPLPEQEKIVELLDKIYAMKEKHTQTVKELEELFPALLDKAFKGEL